MEIARRIVLAIAIMLGIGAALLPVEALVAVRAADFEATQRRKPAWDDASRLPLAEFIAAQTRDRLITVPDPASWDALAWAATEVAAGRDPAAPFADRVGRRFGTDAIYVNPDAEPIRDVAATLDDERTFTYVAVPGLVRGGKRYLEATYLRPRDMGGLEPGRLARPNRRWAGWILLVGLAVYVVLPRPRRGPDILRYHRVRAVVLPDILGAVLTAGFFALPLFVIPSASTTGDLFASGWVVLTAVGWGMACFGLALLAVAAWYAALSFALTADGVRRRTLRGAQEYRFADVVEVRRGAAKPPRRLLGILAILGIFNPRLLAQGLLLAGRTDEALDVAFRDGRRLRVGLTALEGGDRLVRAFEGAARGGVPVAG